MRNVNELTQNELEELRSIWYSQHQDDGSLEEVMGVKEDEHVIEEEIPMSLVKAYYEGTYFVDEDFFCNI